MSSHSVYVRAAILQAFHQGSGHDNIAKHCFIFRRISNLLQWSFCARAIKSEFIDLHHILAVLEGRFEIHLQQGFVAALMAISIAFTRLGEAVGKGRLVKRTRFPFHDVYQLRG